MENQYNIEHAREILEPSGLLGKYLLTDERGVLPGPDIERDLLLLPETEGLRWRPARQLQHLPGAPEVKGTPMLPNPFTARELAAFMLEGAGALVADFYGEWAEGPDPDSLRAIDPDSRARRAVTEAFAAYREAEGIIGPYPRVLQADADRARKAYNEANHRANEREGVSGAVPGTDDSTARRARAVASVAAQEAKMHTTIAASRQASEAWLTAMVVCLLEPQAAAPAPVVADSASNAPAVKTKAKRRTWWDVSSPYIVDVMRAGQYATCKELYRALEAKAGPDSPFDKGTGANRGSLFVREIARALDVKTVQNKWQTLRELAQK